MEFSFLVLAEYCKQRNVCRNPPSPQGCSEKETSRKMGAKQLLFSAQCTCMSTNHNLAVLEHPPQFLDLLLPVSMTKKLF
jgi:hypothetical protein